MYVNNIYGHETDVGKEKVGGAIVFVNDSQAKEITSGWERFPAFSIDAAEVRIITSICI